MSGPGICPCLPRRKRNICNLRNHCWWHRRCCVPTGYAGYAGYGSLDLERDTGAAAASSAPHLGPQPGFCLP
jgi:hypothetical protein